MQNSENENLLKGIAFSTMLMLLAMGSCTVVPAAFAQNASVNVVPASSNIGINGMLVINVTVSDIETPSLFSYQLELHFDPAILEAVNAEVPTGHFMTSASAGKIFVVDGGTIDNNAGFISFAVTLLGDETGKTGSGVLCTATLKGKTEGESSLSLENLILVDTNAANFPAGSFVLNNGIMLVETAPVLSGDLNGDGKVNIQDIILVGAAFGSIRGHPRWNQMADLNEDNGVNIMDLVTVAINFTG